MFSPALLAAVAPAAKAAAAAPVQSRTALYMFLAFVFLTLVITYFSARKSTGSSAYFAAGRRITGFAQA